MCVIVILSKQVTAGAKPANRAFEAPLPVSWVGFAAAVAGIPCVTCGAASGGWAEPGVVLSAAWRGACPRRDGALLPAWHGPLGAAAVKALRPPAGWPSASLDSGRSQ